MSGYPRRIVCLTEETTEILYLLGQGDRVVGVSGYTVRPKEARQKPHVSAFTSARYDKILALHPDLVLAFSDLQSEIVAELCRRGVPVFAFNQRSVLEILQTIRVVGGIVGQGTRGEELADRLVSGLEEIRASACRLPRRPRFFFEEWDDPLISGIQWVDELCEIAGGTPCFPELRACRAAKDRIVDPDRVRAADPEVIIGSWCGKKLKQEKVRARQGWEHVAAVRAGHIYEVKSSIILQPGPAALSDGVRQLHAIVARAAGVEAT